MKKVNTLILRAPGTNCELETQITFQLAGSTTTILPLYRVLKTPITLRDFQIMVIPGGFSFGDYLGSGTIFALRLKKIMPYIISFLENKGMILGFCNGFQVLVRSGLLPDWTNKEYRMQNTECKLNNKASLTFNKSQRFEARWIKLKIINKTYDYIRNMHKTFISLPVAHGEGRFITITSKALNKLYRNNQVLFEYSDSRYPFNPNGSQSNIAGISCPYGQVIGMMPHPERFHSIYLYPNWQKNDFYLSRNNKKYVPDGLLFVKSVVEYVKQKIG